MRIGVSNIAWDPQEDEAVAALLNEHGVDAIDVAPGKYFPDPLQTSDWKIRQVSDYWKQRGIEITGMQALLFGTSGLNLFASDSAQQAMLDHLAAVCRIGACLGGSRLVFGSPRNRDRGSISDEASQEIAVDFFRRLGAIAASNGVFVCLEPNPPCYGANFMTTSDETARIVALTDHPAIKMQLDTGAMKINGEDVAQVIHRYAHLIGHVHASEPGLLPLGDGGVDHVIVHEALSKKLPDHLVTIEMLATKNEPHVQSVDRALTIAGKSYGQEGAGVIS
ncbi:sugar phosphate isomerase/epimerase family protein [Rhodanobacter denitrificans]|uniref:sugar phosphate isomerase/epimerase family protein n=1 Tax=Rhodanobacter denitrificans TaxID=666685 RepID=UPI00121862B5|nr:sugar phosphate isomerase/epimerase [Rhodanobacter denitrificans]TAM60807.1 MAG: sugar phosphate isomerase/epimerase [Rhodanobacter sp.]UJJ59564.1 sugar phosphate isomerase/epimerase [Rhodanobacter denitrificans]